MYGVDSRVTRNLLWKLVRDPHQRVVANALVALMRIGAAGAAEELRKMARNPSAVFRASAAWAMGESGNPAFLPLLDEPVRDLDPNVSRNALKAADRFPKPETCVVEPPPVPLPEQLAEAPAPPATEERRPKRPAGSYNQIEGLRLNEDL
jgi:hypothetical protein